MRALFRLFSGRRHGAVELRRPRRGVRPLIDMPGAFDAPPHVVARLRDVDPLVDLVYIGNGVWSLWVAQRNNYRQRIGERLVANELARPAELQSASRLRIARLFQAGYRVIEMFVDPKDIESGKLVREFRYADWRYRHDANAAFEENLNGSDMDLEFLERVNLILDFHTSEQPSIWAHVFKGRRGVLQPGAGSWDHSVRAS